MGGSACPICHHPGATAGIQGSVSFAAPLQHGPDLVHLLFLLRSKVGVVTISRISLCFLDASMKATRCQATAVSLSLLKRALQRSSIHIRSNSHVDFAAMNWFAPMRTLLLKDLDMSSLRYPLMQKEPHGTHPQSQVWQGVRHSPSRRCCQCQTLSNTQDANSVCQTKKMRHRRYPALPGALSTVQW